MKLTPHTRGALLGTILILSTLLCAQAQDKFQFRQGGYAQALVQVGAPNAQPAVGNPSSEAGSALLRMGVRRAYWGAVASYKGWKVEGQLTAPGTHIDLYKMYIGYSPLRFPAWYAQVGLSPVRFGMELATSSRDRETIERAPYYKDLFPGDVDLGCLVRYTLPGGARAYINHFTAEAALLGGNAKYRVRKAWPDALLRLEAGHRDALMDWRCGASGYVGYVADDSGMRWNRYYIGAHLRYALFLPFGTAKLYAEGIVGQHPAPKGKSTAAAKDLPAHDAMQPRAFTGAMAMMALRANRCPVEGVLKYSYYNRNRLLTKQMQSGRTPDKADFACEGVSHDFLLGVNAYLHRDKVRLSLYYDFVYRQTAADDAFRPIWARHDDLASLALQVAF